HMAARIWPPLLRGPRTTRDKKTPPPDSPLDLPPLFRPAEPVKPRHQRCVQARGDRSGRERNGSNRLLGRALALGLQHRLRHLLNEQRDTIATLDDVLTNVSRKQLVANQPIYDGTDLSLCQSIKCKGGHVVSADP